MKIISNLKRSVKVLKRSEDKGIIPIEVLRYAKGIVFMTQIKGAWVISGTLGSGVIMKRISNDKWSPPSSIGMTSIGAGLQAGAQKTDIVIILNDTAAVKAFESRGQLKLGGDYAISAGPVGRSAQAMMGVSGKGFSGSFSYSMSQGLFAGISLEGAVLVSRGRDNRGFYNIYNNPPLNSILNGEIPVPEAHQSYVNDLHNVLNSIVYGRGFPMDVEVRLQNMNSSTQEEFSDDGMASVNNALQHNNDEPYTPPIGHNNKDVDDLTKLRNKKAATQPPPPPPPPREDIAMAQNGKNLLVHTLSAGDSLAGPSTRDLLGISNNANSSATPTTTVWGQNFDQPIPKTATNPFGNPIPMAIQPQPAIMAQPDNFYNAVRSENAVELLSNCPKLAVTRDHNINENDPSTLAHNIISLNRGDPCYLVDGTLEFGLPVPYQDYVTVQRLSDRKIGKISRHCVTRIN